MARKRKVSYWQRGTWTDAEGNTHTGGYWTTHQGRQVLLAAGPEDEPDGPTYSAAIRAFSDMRAVSMAHVAGDANSCRIVLEMYLQHRESRDAANTFRTKNADLAAFCASLGDEQVNAITPFRIQRWLDDMRKPRPVNRKRRDGTPYKRQAFWGDSAIRRATGNLHAAFAWAKKQGLISRNPVEGVGRPGARSRGRDCIVSPEDHRRILSKTARKPSLRDAVVCLENTGCRPGELLMATASDWDDVRGCLIYYADVRRRDEESRHKTAGKGKDRRIYFTGDALAVMRARVAKHPSGPLWPNRSGKATSIEILGKQFRVLAERLNMPLLTAYSYRHTFATTWLESGRSIDDLAALLGNTPGVIRHHYAHLIENVDRMRDLAEGFTAARSEKPPRVLPFGEAEAAG